MSWRGAGSVPQRCGLLPGTQHSVHACSCPHSSRKSSSRTKSAQQRAAGSSACSHSSTQLFAALPRSSLQPGSAEAVTICSFFHRQELFTDRFCNNSYYQFLVNETQENLSSMDSPLVRRDTRRTLLVPFDMPSDLGDLQRELDRMKHIERVAFFITVHLALG